jgi:hypothetical protein
MLVLCLLYKDGMEHKWHEDGEKELKVRNGSKEKQKHPGSGNRFSSRTSRPASYSVGTGVISRGYNGRGVNLTQLHLVPRLRMNGAVPLLPLHVVILLCIHYLKLTVIFLRVKRPGREADP